MTTPNHRVLAIMPHPDDIEILCGGTLIRLVELGYELHTVTMTEGDKGSAVLPRHEIAAIRRDEGRRGAAVLGARTHRCLEFQDLAICFDNESRRRVAEALRHVDPFLVFTTPPADYMFDHEITSALVRDACFNASVQNYATKTGAPTSGVPYLYYSDAIGGHDLFGEPSATSTIIDISAQIDKKAEALCCHDSQRAWLQKQHGMDNYIESMKEWSRQRGFLIESAYAEAFCQHRGHPHPQDDIVASLLG